MDRVLGWDTFHHAAQGGGRSARGEESEVEKGVGGKSDEGEEGKNLDGQGIGSRKTQGEAWRVVRALRPLCGELQACLRRGDKRWRPRGVDLRAETVLFQTEASYTLCPFPAAFLQSLRSHGRSWPGARARVTGLPTASIAVCLEPASVCEIAWALQLPALMVISGRLEKGREQPARWRHFVEALQCAAGDDTLAVATSAYDAAYTHYLTGVAPRLARALPAAAARVRFDPLGPVWVVHCDEVFGPHDTLSAGILGLLQGRGVPSERMSVSEAGARAAGGGGGAGDVRVRAIVWLPCDVEAAGLWQWFAAGVPIAAPSLDLLVEWEQVFGLLSRRLHWPDVPRVPCAHRHCALVHAEKKRSGDFARDVGREMLSRGRGEEDVPASTNGEGLGDGSQGEEEGEEGEGFYQRREGTRRRQSHPPELHPSNTSGCGPSPPIPSTLTILKSYNVLAPLILDLEL